MPTGEVKAFYNIHEPDEVDSITEQIAESLAPVYSEDARKTRYLSYRASGFTVRECAHLMDIHYRTIMRWRANDPEFNAMDTSGMNQLRERYGKHFAYTEFLRNFRLVMEKDFDVLYKVNNAREEMTKEDYVYLNKIRGQYTPEALTHIQRAVAGNEQQVINQFNFTKFVLENSRQSIEERFTEEGDKFIDGDVA